MKVLVVAQNKGGVGKTTTCRLMAEYCGLRHGQDSHRPLRALVIDLDSQCNLSQRFLPMEIGSEFGGRMPPIHPDYEGEDDWDGRSDSAELFFSGTFAPYPTLSASGEPRFANVDILPGSETRLLDVEKDRPATLQASVYDRLNEVLSQPDVREAYDLVIIDTSPSKGPLAISAFRAATHLLIPFQPEPQCQEGLEGMLRMRRDQNSYRRTPLEIIGILPNRVRSNVILHQDTLKELEQDAKLGGLLMRTQLKDRIAFAESDHPGMVPRSVFELSATDKARLEAESVCASVIQHMFGDHP
ncbi:MAG: ParA family protein [Gammaproteobacteria bacterium]